MEPNFKKYQKAVKEKYELHVTNMLKQVCNMEFFIEKYKGTIETKIKKLEPEKTHYICRKDHNFESMRYTCKRRR